MARIKKVAKDGHRATLSPYVSEFISKCLTEPLPTLSAHLATFPRQWGFPKSDLYSWILVLNRFDKILDLIITEYKLRLGPQTEPFRLTVLSQGDGEDLSHATEAELRQQGHAADGDCQLAKDVVEFSAFLLDHSSNRGLYSSQDAVNHLLNTSSISLLKSVLKLCLPLAVRFYANKARYSHHSSSHSLLLLSHYNINQDRLQKIAAGFGKRCNPSSHYDSIPGKGKSKETTHSHNGNDISLLLKSRDIPDTARQAFTEVSISYYDRSATTSSSTAAAAAQQQDELASPASPTPARKSNLGPAGKASGADTSQKSDAASSTGPKTFHIPSEALQKESLESLLERNLIKVPAAYHYDLLHQLRTAKAFLGSKQGVEDLIACRILAVANLAYTLVDTNFQLRLGHVDAEQPREFQLAYQLADLLQPQGDASMPISKEIQVYTLNALEALVKVKSKATDVGAALNVGVSHGVLFWTFRAVITSLEKNIEDNVEREWRHSVMTLIHALAAPPTTYHRNSDAMVAAGIITLWVQALVIRTPEAQSMYSDVIHFLDIFVNNGVRDSFEYLVSADGLNIIAKLTLDLVNGSLSDLENGDGMPAKYKTKVTDYSISFFKQQALRQMFKFVQHMFNLHMNRDRHLRNLIDTPQMLEALKKVIDRPQIFGSNVWMSSVSIVGSFIHSEPTSYNIVNEAGLVAGILDSVAPPDASETPNPSRILPVGETLREIPNAFGAICLNEAGMKLFRKSKALDTYLSAFTSLDHVEAMENDHDCAVSIGSSFDELVRHHPELRTQVMDSILRMIKRVTEYCRQRALDNGNGAKLWYQESGDDGPRVCGGRSGIVGPDYTHPLFDGVDGNANPVMDADIESDDLQHGRTSGRMPVDVISVTAKFLQGFLSNSSLLNNFCEKGGVAYLVALFIPNANPWNISELSTYDDMTTVLRLVMESKSHLLFPLMIKKAADILEFINPFLTAPRDKFFFEPLTNIRYATEAPTDPADREHFEMLRQKGSWLLKALIALDVLGNFFADVLESQYYLGQRSAGTNIINHLNLTDYWVQLVDGYNSLHRACICELIHLHNVLPNEWKERTRPTVFMYTAMEMESLMGLPTDSKPNEADSTDQLLRENGHEIERNHAASFMNVRLLRYLLAEIPTTANWMQQHLGKALFSKNRPSASELNRQNAAVIAERAGSAIVSLLDSPFPNVGGHKNLDRVRYQVLVLSGIFKTLYDKRPYRRSQPEIVVVVLNQCFAQGGFQKINEWVLELEKQLKSASLDDETMPFRSASSSAIGLTLSFYSKVCSAKVLESSPNANVVSAASVEGSHGYFDPAQLLVELRNVVYPVVKELWEPEDGRSSFVHTDDLRALIGILKSILKGDGETRARTSRSRKTPTWVKFVSKHSEGLKAMIMAGTPRDMAMEALFRCNDAIHLARDYCALRQELPQIDRLPPPEDAVQPIASDDWEAGPGGSAAGETTPSTSSASVPSVNMQDADESDPVDNDDLMNDDDPTTSMFTNPNGVVTSLANQTSDTLNIDSDTGTEVRSTVNELPTQPPSSEVATTTMTTVEDLDKKRVILGAHLVDRCIDVLNEHSKATFDIADLINAATSNTRMEGKELKENIGETLTMSLVSLSADESPERSKKIGAVAHLLALILQDQEFFLPALESLKANFDELVQLLKVTPDEKFEESTPHLSNVLLVIERLLVHDEQPQVVPWKLPHSDEIPEQDPIILEEPCVSLEDRGVLFAAIMDLLPRIAKNDMFALSVIRVLVMLTRRRQISNRLSEKQNMSRLFLMVKQLCGFANDKLQSGFLQILRHVVEDEQVVREIMRTEIYNFFETSRVSRSMDCSAYTRHLYHLVLRDPDMFVEVSAEMIELVKWDPQTRPQALGLKKQDDKPDETNSGEKAPEQAALQSSTDKSTEKKPSLERTKTSEIKPPVVENPDGIIYYIMRELSNYRDVDVTEGAANAPTPAPGRSETPDIEMPDMTPPPDLPPNLRLPLPQPKSGLKVFKTEDHPIFAYRCVLLHSLVELLACYNRTKIEFINFSTRTDSVPTTPSKPRSGFLHYLLTQMLPVGTLEHADDINHRKKVTLASWAASTIVSLCAKTQEHARHVRPLFNRYTEDESELVYVRRFVLEQVSKALNSAMQGSESLDLRYSRLLGLSDVIYRMLNGKLNTPNGQLTSEAVTASSRNMAKLMYEKHFVSSLTASVAEIDLNFPNAKRAIKYILRPLKVLTDTAVQLSLTSESTAPETTEDDDIFSATSISSHDSHERDATPDIFRNSTLGQFEPRAEESESSEDEDEDGYYGGEYDDEMDYEDDRPVADHGEVVSDDEDGPDGMGPIEGMTGDVNMDLEIVMEDGSDDSEEDSDEDDSDDLEDDNDDEGMEDEGDVEIIDEEINGDRVNDSGPDGMDEDEGDWEDDDEDVDAEDEDEMDEMLYHSSNVPLDALAHFDHDARSDLMNRLADAVRPPNRGGLEMDQDYYETPPDEDDEDGEEYDEEVVYEPEAEFDEEDDDDEDEEEVGPFHSVWRQQPGGARLFRQHINYHTRIPPDPWGSRDAPFEAYTSMRSHRPGAAGRGNDDGTNPLLHRNDARSTPVPSRPDFRPFSDSLFAEYGPAGARIMSGRQPELPNFLREVLSMVGPPGGRVEAITDRDGATTGFSPWVVSNGSGFQVPQPRHQRASAGLQGNISMQQGHRQEGPLPTRPPTSDPGQAVAFMPAQTVARWQDEARLLYGQDHQTEAVKVTNAMLRRLTPSAAEAKRRRDKEEAEKRAVQEEQQRKMKEAERIEREKKEQKEKEEREAKEAAEAEERAQRAREAEANPADVSMEGVEQTEATTQTSEPAAEDPAQRREYYNVRGNMIDLTELNIDRAFLDEIPEEMRDDVVMAQIQQRLEQRANRPQAGTTGRNVASSSQPAPNPSVPDEIDREFLSALPSEIQQELLRAEATERNRREREEARRQATAAGRAHATQPEEMGNADFMAMLEPALRQSVLMEADDATLASLPAGIRAEAEALMEASYGPRARIQDLAERRPPPLGLANPLPTTQTEGDRPRRPVVQILDKAGVATLLRLMFVTLTGSAKAAMLGILTDICRNTQNRAEVISILLSILQDGSSDSVALDKSFMQLTTRAKQVSGPKTPQPLRRTLTGQNPPPPSADASPLIIVQQCLTALGSLAAENPRIPHFFLTEHETISNQRAKTPKKGKAKENKSQRYPINALLTLLDRKTVIENASVMENLAGLLVRLTEPLKTYLKRVKDEEKKADEQTNTTTADAEGSAEQVAASAGPEAEAGATDTASVGQATTDEAQPAAEASNETKKEDPVEQKKKPKDVPPPEIPEENLCLVVNIIAARECNGKTFQNTLDLVNHLSAIPGARDVFGKELVRRAHELAAEVLGDLQQLPEQIRNAESSTAMQGRALVAFSPASSHQNKLLRVLLALDYIFDPKRAIDRPNANVASEGLAQQAKADLVSSLYNDCTFVQLWNTLSECLVSIRERGNMNNIATILQPLIEAFMVVCKNTAAKDGQIIPSKDTGSPAPESGIEGLFFRFTEAHRKILNDLVRQNPKLMNGTFDVLVKNSKVLEFDNKRNFFSKRLHQRSADERVQHQTLQLNVRRSEVFLDSFKSLFFKKPQEIKYGKLNIRFQGEEGVDAGGVTREWFAAMSRQMFNPNYALFNPVAADRTTFHPNPLSAINEQHLTFFRFIGRIIGKALYENRVLDCHFSRAVYKRILSKPVSLKDMETLDLDYYKSLMWMLENDITDVAFETFSVEVDNFGETAIVDLKPGGRDIPVTQENKHEYVKLVVEQRLTKSVEEQLEHFLLGFREIVPLELISIFNEQELELLISGLPDIDVDDWKNNTEYHNYQQTSPQVQWFWRAVRSFDQEEKAKLLQFVTGTSKVPLNGFRELEGMNGFSRFNIHRDFGNKERLPSSHTCFNQLDLPEYETYEMLRRQLYTAMTVGNDHFGFA